MKKTIEEQMEEMKKLVAKNDGPPVVLCVGSTPKHSISHAIHLVRPMDHPPICIMSDKTTGIEPVFSIIKPRRLLDEENETKAYKMDFRRIVRKITDT